VIYLNQKSVFGRQWRKSMMIFDVPTDKSRVATYIEEELKQKLEKLAALEDRSVSNFLERLIKQVVEQAEREGKI
ncbi:MAG: ribbon-helix-helix protein, CopG family, partial [Leptolyngbyaceae cyanobacterium bins.302]|nr:ribbon-helix-helix protein, CopG family [Leptolyngbyaceae cyanobacterium bins.302]